MGYNLAIGEYVCHADPEGRTASAGVVPMELPEAPPNSTCKDGDRTNEIYPGYCAWSEFTRRVGLYDVFFAHIEHKDGKRKNSVWMHGLHEHPGLIEGEANALTRDHLERFRLARSQHRPNVDGEDGVDYDQRRLDWLCWWTEWALENCEFPTFGSD